MIWMSRLPHNVSSCRHCGQPLTRRSTRHRWRHASNLSIYCSKAIAEPINQGKDT